MKVSIAAALAGKARLVTELSDAEHSLPRHLAPRGADRRGVRLNQDTGKNRQSRTCRQLGGDQNSWRLAKRPKLALAGSFLSNFHNPARTVGPSYARHRGDAANSTIVTRGTRYVRPQIWWRRLSRTFNRWIFEGFLASTVGNYSCELVTLFAGTPAGRRISRGQLPKNCGGNNSLVFVSTMSAPTENSRQSVPCADEGGDPEFGTSGHSYCQRPLSRPSATES